MDLFLFSEKDVKWFQERGCELVKINMEPGDFVLWDSRTMHYACLPEGDQIRHVQYICMTPRRFATPETLELKKECFENFTGTTHWPHW
jgi:ectoine hydroxylase-related dioxygenase (phytanoyl-CoA dioxygenase family)